MNSGAKYVNVLELVSECVESYIARGVYGFEVQASERCGGYTA